MIAGRSRTPRLNGISRPPPVVGPHPPPLPSPDPGLTTGVPIPPVGPKPPPVLGPPLPALVNILPGAPLKSRSSAAARPRGLLVFGDVAAAPKIWSCRPRAAFPVPSPRPGMRMESSPSPPTTSHAMVVCLAGRGPPSALAPCKLPSAPAPAPACDPALPAAVLASALAILSTLSSFLSALAPGLGRK